MKIERITVCNIASLAGTHSLILPKIRSERPGFFRSAEQPELAKARCSMGCAWRCSI